MAQGAAYEPYDRPRFVPLRFHRCNTTIRASGSAAGSAAADPPAPERGGNGARRVVRSTGPRGRTPGRDRAGTKGVRRTATGEPPGEAGAGEAVGARRLGARHADGGPDPLAGV